MFTVSSRNNVNDPLNLAVDYDRTEFCDSTFRLPRFLKTCMLLWTIITIKLFHAYN